MEACTFEADQLGRKQPKASKDWLVGTIEIIWRCIMELWESRNQDKHGIDADKEDKAKQLMLPRVRGLCERCSHLPPKATETVLDVDLETRERQTMRQIQQWLLVAEPHLRQQEKAVKEQERQGKKHPEARHQDLREHISVAPKSLTRQAPTATGIAAHKNLKQSLLPTGSANTQRRTITHAPNTTSTSRATPKKLQQPTLYQFMHHGPTRDASTHKPP
jgi:hypothetical protein